MKSIASALSQQWVELLFLIALAALSIQLFVQKHAKPDYCDAIWMRADQGKANLSLRTQDFPQTFIESIHVDLSAPHQWVTLGWSGPFAGSQENGPFHSSPGCGTGMNNCDDFVESNQSKSNCTPKGNAIVEGFSDNMPSILACKFVTWINTNREIAFHSYPEVPNYAASHGCIRLEEHAAQLIHNNAITGKTKVVIDGTWTDPREVAAE
jgi:hypothetical protein